MRYLIIALLSVVFVSCNQRENANELQLTANIKGLKKESYTFKKSSTRRLWLLTVLSSTATPQFSTTIALDSPQMFYLFLDRGVTNSIDNNLPFFAEPGKMTIETTLDHFLSDAKITGSKNQQQYEDFKKGLSRYNDRNLELVEAKFNALKTGNPKLIDSIEVLQDATIKRRYLYAANFALNHKDAEIAPFVTLSEIPDINLRLLDTIQKSMTPKVAQSYYGKRLVAFYKQREKAGE
jgi:hypothetical protein